MSTKKSMPFPTRKQYPTGLTEACDNWFKTTAETISGAALDTLIALMRDGPLWDGDVPSKSGRDELLDIGLAVKIVVSGKAMPSVCSPYIKPPPLIPDNEVHKGYSEGFQAATYLGSRVFSALLESGRVKR